LEQLVHEAKLDQLVQHQLLQVQLVQLVQLDQQVQPAQHQLLQDRLDQLALLVQQVQLDHRELLDQLVHVEHLSQTILFRRSLLLKETLGLTQKTAQCLSTTTDTGLRLEHQSLVEQLVQLVQLEQLVQQARKV
jgi:hypothetical protein